MAVPGWLRPRLKLLGNVAIVPRNVAGRRLEGELRPPFPSCFKTTRCKAAQQLYQSAGELTLVHHNVAAQGLVHLYPAMESGKAKSLNNQIFCMILEYHLTCFSQGSCTSLVLLEATEDLLPPMDEYLVGGNF